MEGTTEETGGMFYETIVNVSLHHEKHSYLSQRVVSVEVASQGVGALHSGTQLP